MNNFCERQYNKDVKNPTNFSFDKQSYKAGWRRALEFVQKHCLIGKAGASLIEKELQDESD